jgi:hypothetical protein
MSVLPSIQPFLPAGKKAADKAALFSVFGADKPVPQAISPAALNFFSL